MSGTIQINQAEFDSKKLMCEGCANALLTASASNAVPVASGDAPAMQAFMRKLTDLGMLVSAYKEVLQADVAALEAAKRSLVEADRASTGNF